MYTIKLADGTILDNLELNGNNFVSDEIIDDEVFEGNLGTVTITDGSGESVEYHDMVLVQNVTVNGKSWFILAEMTHEQKLVRDIKSAIAAGEANMTDVQLALAEIYEMLV